MAECGVLDLDAANLAIVRRILEEHIPDRPVFVFGSRVTGRAQRLSDLDLAIGGKEPLTLGLEGDLKEAFDQSDLPIEVDIVDLATVSESFRRRIMSEWIELDRSSAAPQEKEVHA